MSAWLVLLRSRLLLPPETAAQQAAAQAGDRLCDRLLALQAAQALAARLEEWPQLGHDVFLRGQPELLGTAVEPAAWADNIEVLWASMALFDDAPQDAAIATVYRPPWQALYSSSSSMEARQRVLALVAAMPDGAWLDQLLPRVRRAASWPAWSWPGRAWRC